MGRQNTRWSGDACQGIIEGGQIEVTTFYLESFGYLIGLVTANHNACGNSVRARRLIQI